MSVMGRLLAGNAPLRGRAGLEMVIKPFGYRDAARFWGVTDPGLAALLHAIAGGTPAYRRQFVRTTPRLACRLRRLGAGPVLNPDRPLIREARYLLAEETDIRDPALYHSVLAAVAAGNGRLGCDCELYRAQVVGHRPSPQRARGLRLDRQGRRRIPGRAGPVTRITEPLITFYEAIMRPRWADLEEGLGSRVWADSRQQFRLGGRRPAFRGGVQGLRDGARTRSVRHGRWAVSPQAPSPIRPDAARSRSTWRCWARRFRARVGTVISLGEAKWGDTMGMRHLCPAPESS